MKIFAKNLLISAPIHRLWVHFCSDSLFRNSAYLILSTTTQGALGFVFWLICARLYSPEAIGLGSTLLSVVGFISYISLLGLNSSLIRFLPNSNEKNKKINSSLTLVLSAAIIVSILYLIFLPKISPELSFLTKNPIFTIAFIFLSAFSALNLLTDSIFIAYRASKYNFIKYTFQSLAKLALPIALVTLGAFGVFASSSIAFVLAFFLSLYYLAKKFKFKPSFSVNSGIVKNLWKFSSANYIAELLNTLPTIVMPIIILNKLGAAQAGYFYLAFMLSNFLYSIAYSVASSLFAEASYGKDALRKILKQAGIFLAAIMLPAGIALAFIGPFILRIFGKSYGNEAAAVIVVLAMAVPAVAAYSLGGIILRVKKQIIALILMDIVYAATISGLTILWVNRGISWVAGAWLIGHLIAAIIAFMFVYLPRLRNKN